MTDPTMPVSLDPIEQRVVGSLLEKQVSVPGSYPLSLNALRKACNQTASRDPITDYDDATLVAAVDQLKQRGLARVVWAGTGSRVLKYHQRLTDAIDLDDPSRALVTVLLLRGTQSLGELRTRSERLYRFADLNAVETTLRALAERRVPIVAEVGPQRGQQGTRWTHLLGPTTGSDDAPPTHEDRESVLERGASARDAAVAAAYDASADVPPDLADLPLDRWLLDRVAGLAGPGPVADIGCGRGRVTAYLAEAGVQVVGSDLSPGAIAAARLTHPSIDFEVGNFTHLLRPRRAAGWSAVTGWYAFSHLAPSELEGTLRALSDTIVPGGALAFAVYLGTGLLRQTPTDDDRTDPPAVLFDRAQVLDAVAASGLVDVEWYIRGPRGTTDPHDRLYVLARTATH